MTDKTYPPIRCTGQHPDTLLCDVVGDDGTIVQACPECTPLVLKDVVRQLHVRADAKETGT
jgi:hypothetical protein